MVMARSLTRRSFVGSLALLAVTCVSGCDGAKTESATLETEWGTVPNVKGMPVQEAWHTLADAGYLPELEHSDAEGEPGTVVKLRVREAPDAVRSILDPNGEVHGEYDNVSWKACVYCGVCGMSQIPLQLTLGNSETEARAQLEEAGFLEVESAYLGEVDETANVVTEVTPALGAWAMEDEQVTITVTSDVTMPDVLGDDPLTATQHLRARGLVPNPAITEYMVEDGFIPTVESASAEPGATLRVGDVVELTYTTAP